MRRQLADDVPLGRQVETTVLDHLAEHAVRDLWAGRIKTFVPVLALRQARELLHEQDMLITVEHVEQHAAPAARALPAQDALPARDVLAIQDDVLPLDERDVLPF